MHSVIHNRLLESLHRQYGIPRSSEYFLSSLDDNSNLYIINGGGQKKILKRNWLLTIDRTTKLEELLVQLCASDITPWVFKTKNGRYHFKLDGEIFSLMAYIVKQPMDFHVCFEAAIGRIANMHIIMSEIEHDNLMAPLAVDYEDLQAVYNKYNCSELIYLLDQVSELKDAVRRQLVHNDLHPGNFIQAVSGKVYLIDFDSYSVNYLIADVMFAAFRLGNGNINFITDFLEKYDSLNPLTEEEKKYAFLFLANDFAKKIGFILHEKEKGDGFYMKDYDKYNNYLKQTLAIMNSGSWLSGSNKF